MTSVRDCRRPHQERPLVSTSVASYIAPLDSFPPPESGDKLFDQLAGLLGPKPLADAPAAATHIAKYSEEDLQRILKTVLKARALAPASAPAPIVTKVSWEKLKARFPNVYCGKSHIDCYNFCQQCENYFATARVTGPTQILFATSFLWDRISFCW